MFEADKLKPKLVQMEGKKQELGAQLKIIKDEINEKAKVTEEKLGLLKKKRKEIIAKLPSELVKKFDEVKAKKGGIAVAVMKNKICDACRMEISSGEADQIKDPSKLYKCPICGRILIIYNDSMDSIKAESSLVRTHPNTDSLARYILCHQPIRVAVFPGSLTSLNSYGGYYRTASSRLHSPNSSISAG